MAVLTRYQDQYAALTSAVKRWDRRARVGRSLIWLPRALIAALIVGLVLAVISRLYPFLMPGQIAWATAAATAAALVIAWAVIWLRERSPHRLALRYDVVLDLGERVSTALELIEGRIQSNDELTALQLNDAQTWADQADPRTAIPLRVHRRDWLVLLALAAALVVLLVLPNPQLDALAENAAQEAAIEQAQDETRQLEQDIAADPDLRDPERQSLLEALNATQDILNRDGVSPEEAFASLSNLQNELSRSANDMLQRSAAAQAAMNQAANRLRELAGEQPNDASSQGDTSPENLSDLLNQLAQQMEQMSGQQQQDAANAFQQAANGLQDTTPQLAQALQQAGQSLQQGDTQGAQQQAQQAAQQAAQSQQAAQQQAQAGQRAQQRAQQAGENANEVAQSAQQQAQNASQAQQNQQNSQAQQNQQQDGDQQASAQQQADSAQQPGQDGQESPNSSSQSQALSQQAQTASQQQEGDQAGGEDGQSLQSESQSNASPQSGAPNDSSSPQQANDSSSSDTSQAGSSGAGDASADSSANASPYQGSRVEANNSPDGGGEGEYQSIYAPSRIGGESSAENQLFLESDPGSIPSVQGNFSENPSGQTSVPYNQVFSDYRAAANQALNQNYVPPSLRDLVRSYFSSLEPNNSSARTTP